MIEYRPIPRDEIERGVIGWMRALPAKEQYPEMSQFWIVVEVIEIREKCLTVVGVGGTDNTCILLHGDDVLLYRKIVR